MGIACQLIKCLSTRPERPVAVLHHVLELDAPVSSDLAEGQLTPFEQGHQVRPGNTQEVCCLLGRQLSAMGYKRHSVAGGHFGKNVDQHAKGRHRHSDVLITVYDPKASCLPPPYARREQTRTLAGQFSLAWARYCWSGTALCGPAHGWGPPVTQCQYSAKRNKCNIRNNRKTGITLIKMTRKGFILLYLAELGSQESLERRLLAPPQCGSTGAWRQRQFGEPSDPI